MELTFAGRGLPLDEDLRNAAEHKLSRLARLEPRTTRIDLEFVVEHHPRPEGTKRVGAALKVPRKTFFAEAEAGDVKSALDLVAERLERQIRDYHGRRKARLMRRGNALESAHPASAPADTAGEASGSDRGGP